MESKTVKRVNISLSAKTLKQIDAVTKPGERSRFIDQAVNYYVRKLKQNNLRTELKEESLKRARFNRDLSAEWFHLEEEIWPKNNQ